MGEVAGKRDLGELEHQTDDKFAALRRDIAELKTELKRDIAELRTEFDAKLRDVENRLVIKLGAMMAALLALMFAALKLSA